MTPLSDAHCHFFSPRFLETLALQRGGGADPRGVAADLGWDYPETPEDLADRWLAELDRQGVSRVALIASVHGDEESVARAVLRHPERFVGLSFIDPTQDDTERRVEVALRDLGLRGACLLPAMHHYPLVDDRVLGVAEILARQPGSVLWVHCGLLSVGARRQLGLASRFEMRFGNPLDLQLVATTFPTLPIVIPHFGGGLFREALMLADACPNVHFDTSSSNHWIRFHPGLTLAGVFRHALDVVGPARLLFGTDSSYFPRGWQRPIYETQRTVLGEIGAAPEVAAAVFGGTFDALFPVRE
jgi:hypothetical protein